MNNGISWSHIELSQRYDNLIFRCWLFCCGNRPYASFNYFFLVILCFLIVGCSSTIRPVPVVDRGLTDTEQSVILVDEKEEGFYIVKEGDTLYSIAIDQGINLRALAEQNNITDLSAIEPGQRISLLATTTTNQQAQPVISALPQPALSSEAVADTPSYLIPLSANRGGARIKTEPRALKLPYSKEAVITVRNLTQQAAMIVPAAVANIDSGVGPVGNVDTRIEVAPVIEVPQITKPQVPATVPASKLSVSGIEWIWPAEGTVLETFSSKTKGVKISGESGQAVVASAAGDVVYSGNGLRGYGNLIIIKHSKRFLSAYAHNSKIMVEEGETVNRGQKIAEMGKTDTDTVQLHFEIRKQGKPVDPFKYLPARS